MESALPKVILAVVVVKDGKILMGKRKGSNPGQGMYGTPGGHLELGESIAECVLRELKEEVAIEVTNMRFLSITNVRAFPPKHFVAISVLVDWKSGEPILCEPDLCEAWEWVDPRHPPTPMTPATETSLEAYLDKTSVFFESTVGLNTSGETF